MNFTTITTTAVSSAPSQTTQPGQTTQTGDISTVTTGTGTTGTGTTPYQFGTTTAKDDGLPGTALCIYSLATLRKMEGKVAVLIFRSSEMQF